ncbi:MAG: hypothetical protein HY703_08130 [Gemmatimonadetes bacterium]|nr:hypothetical protein [Gemmatimonadota bacterium]
MLLDLGRQPEHPHDLCDPSPGDPFPPGNLGLVGGVAGLDEDLPDCRSRFSVK